MYAHTNTHSKTHTHTHTHTHTGVLVIHIVDHILMVTLFLILCRESKKLMKVHHTYAAISELKLNREELLFTSITNFQKDPPVSLLKQIALKDVEEAQWEIIFH